MANIIHNLSTTFNVDIHRGDTKILHIPVLKYDNGDHDITYNTGAIYFGVMEANAPFESSIIKKKYSYNDLDDSGILHVRLDPVDTECLYPGTYYYSVKSYKLWSDSEEEHEEVHTIISDSKFVIM